MPRHLYLSPDDKVRLIPRSAATVVVAIGVLVLIAWQFGIESLQGFVPSFPKMNPLTAVDFIASAVALWLMLPESSPRIRHRIGQILSGVAGLSGLLMLVGIFYSWNPGIDEILFRSRVIPVGHAAARMAPGTAVNFVLIATSLLFLNLEIRRDNRPAQFLAFVAGAIAIIDVTGYAYGGQPFVGYRVYRSMALPTALSFLLLAIGILLSRPRHGFVAVCFGSGTGAIVARRLLPVAIAAPILLGWLRILGQRRGWFGTEAGVAFTSAAYIIVLAMIVLWTVQALQQIDSQREAAQQNLKKSEEMYRARTTELEAANKELESFSYSVSHDLRAPLRGIDGFSRILADDYGDQIGEDGRHCISRICEAAKRMGELIDDLLNLSKVTRAEMRREQVDLTSIASSIAKDLRSAHPERDIEIDIAFGLRAEGDPRLVRVVLENLIGNAWKFTTKQDRARIELGSTQTDGTPLFFVRDNGAGFNQDHAARLFGAFQRLHRNDEFSGTGVGLATVERIILRHGGKIWGEGVTGKGATFYFTFGSSTASRSPVHFAHR